MISGIDLARKDLRQKVGTLVLVSPDDERHNRLLDAACRASIILNDMGENCFNKPEFWD